MPRSLPNDAVIHMTEDYFNWPMDEIPLEVLSAFSMEYRLEKNPTVKRVFQREFQIVKSELKRRVRYEKNNK